MNFKEIAKEKTTKAVSALMQNKVKVSMDEIITSFPDGVTIVAVDMLELTDEQTGEISTVPVINFDENIGVFAFGGKVLHDIVSAWIEMCDGDPALVSKNLLEQGGVKVKFSKGRTKKGRNIINVEVID